MLRNVRQATVALVTAGCVVGAGILVSSPGGAGASGGNGPTAEAAARTLQVTASEGGSLARADTTSVVYDGTGGRVDGGPAGSDIEAQSASAVTVARIAAAECPPASTSSTSSSSSTSTTSTTAPTTTTTDPCATTTSTSTSSTTSTTATTAPAPTEPRVEEPEPSDPPQGDDEPMVDGSAPTGNQPTGGDDTPDTTGGSLSATLTELLPIGSTADRGTVLYRADAEPIVALLSVDPLFRELTTGVTDGPDVQALEANLGALGYGSGITVDEHFDGATAAAVERWETALGRAAPDGVVTVGEVVYLDEPTAVLEHQVAVGDLLESGDPVLVLGAESRVVETDIDAAEIEDWAVGTEVELGWGDDSTSQGTVTEVSRDESGGEVDLVVTISGDGGTDRPIGSAVEVVRTVADREAALAVPVAAIVQGAEGPSVRLVDGDADRLVPVELGIVAGGWVEVTDGLDASAEVRLPG